MVCALYWRGPRDLRHGERVIVHHDPAEPEPLGVHALPEHYDELELRMVPEEERTAEKYSNFYLSIATLDLNTKFKLISEGAVSNAE